jgi:uncharacterized membrane protein
VLGLFGEFNDAHLLFLGGLPRGVLLVLALLALGVLVFSFFDLKDQRPWKRAVLLGLRALALGGALLLLLEPALELRHVTKIRNHVVVLVDDSLSMTLPHDPESTRWAQATGAVTDARERFAQPDEDHYFALFRFGETVRPSTPGELESAVPGSRATHLLEALNDIAERFPRRELGGVVIVSDGTDSGALGGRVRHGEALDAETRAFVEGLDAPLHTLALGDPDAVRDLAIERVLVDDFAFVRNRVTIEVVVSAIGFGQALVPVTLRREGEVLQTREVVVEAGQTEYRVLFEFIPEQIGKEIYSVTVPRLSGEPVEANNRAYFILKIIRDKIRVLQVCGRPSWDERFLRELLKRNPNVDLISFFILRTDADLQLVPNDELSLIPFPTEELFEEQLGSFDLVIFQNFTYRPYGMYRYLDRIEEYVRGGGAFAMIGGEQSFASGGYTGTPVANLLPVGLPPEGPEHVLIDVAPFSPVLTDAGRHHPITQLEFTRSENQRAWEALPALEGTNVVLAARPGATVLLTHPTLRSSGEPLPVLSVVEVGDGRSLALTSDASWRWSFGSVGRGGTSRGYTTFWNSAIRWLIQDPELRLIQVEAPQAPVVPGDSFDVAIRVLRPDYQPAAGASGTWELYHRPLDRLGEVAAEERVAGDVFTTDDRGRVVLSLVVDREGAYELRASADLEDTGRISDEDIFLGLEDTRELRDIVPRPDLLEQLSEASAGGRAFDEAPELDDLPFRAARTVQVNRRKLLDVWSTPWALGFFALVLGLEWTLRRRWGRL